MYQLINNIIKPISLIFLVAAICFILSAFYIPVKAKLAQIMLNRAWEETLNNERLTKPWPWADTHPLARLRVPRHSIDQIILAGDQGNSLAFGPGLHPASDTDKASGMLLISGHRDTHFTFLKDVKMGDIFELQTMDRNSMRYRVEYIQIVNTRDAQLQSPDNNKWLTLVTCYPFNTIRSNPLLRYVVMAEAITP